MHPMLWALSLVAALGSVFTPALLLATPPPPFLLSWGSEGSGPGQFNHPTGIGIDPAGFIFVADSGNQRIQKFTAQGTFVSSWSASFGNASGLSIDAQGNVYVADTANKNIWKFTGSGTPLYRTGSWGYDDVAVSPSGQFVYGVYLRQIHVFAADVGTFIETISCTTCGFGAFHGIDVDDLGHFWVTRSGADPGPVVFELDSSGAVLRSWGADEFNGPRGVELDGEGNVYVVDEGNDQVQKRTLGGMPITTIGFPNGQFRLPFGIAVKADGGFFVADYTWPGIMAFDAAGAFVRSWPDNGPGHATLDDDGYLYVVDMAGYRIEKFAEDGTLIFAMGGPGSGPGEMTPAGVDIDANGNIYVADYDNNRIQKFAPTGFYLAEWGSPGSGPGQFSGPWDVAADGSGHVYVADSGNRRIQKWTTSGEFLLTWGQQGGAPGEFQSPTGVHVGPGGVVYVADWGNGRIQKFQSDGAFLAVIGSLGTAHGQFTYPSDVSTDSDGNIYVVEAYDNHRVQKLDPAGNFLNAWGENKKALGQFDLPQYMAVDGAGNIYVADWGNHRIQKFGYASTAVRPEVPIMPRLIRAFPNPSMGSVKLELVLPEAGDGSKRAYHVRGQVFDLSGRLVEEIPAATLTSSSAALLQWSAGRNHIPSGMYLIRVMADGTSLGTTKVLITR